jgi:hypothetical protein
MRTVIVIAATLGALLLAVPAGAQSELPTELWSEYPLVQTVEGVERGETKTGSAIGPFLPPDPEAAPAPGESTRWSLWLVLLGLGALALLFAARAAPPVAASGARELGRGARRLSPGTRPRSRPRAGNPKALPLREPPPRPRARVARPQYAPPLPATVPEPGDEPEPRRYVVRRTGLLQARFVVVADEPGGEVKQLSGSRSFWRVGAAGARERAAAEAWDELIDALRAEGWEPATQRSDYYVLLRRVDDGSVSILPTIEAYARAPDENDPG